MTHDVYQMIRTLILQGEYIGGEPMPEQELAARLNVSRTPVREALRRLQAEGVVERRSNRRVHLVEVNPNSVIEIFAIRARLEPLASRLAAERADDAFIELLSDRIERMELARRRARPDLKLYRQANEDYHWAILAQSGNAALEATVRNVARRQINGPTFTGWNADELERSQQHHRELVAAFRAADANWAEAVMALHLHAAHAAYSRIAAATTGQEARSAPPKAPRGALKTPADNGCLDDRPAEPADATQGGIARDTTA